MAEELDGEKGINAVLLAFPSANLLLFLNSLHVFLYRGHPLLRWHGDVGLPSTRGECHVTSVLYPNLWNRNDV